MEIGIVWVKWSEGDCADDLVMRLVADVVAIIWVMAMLKRVRARCAAHDYLDCHADIGPQRADFRVRHQTTRACEHSRKVSSIIENTAVDTSVANVRTAINTAIVISINITMHIMT